MRSHFPLHACTRPRVRQCVGDKIEMCVVRVPNEIFELSADLTSYPTGRRDLGQASRQLQLLLRQKHTATDQSNCPDERLATQCLTRCNGGDNHDGTKGQGRITEAWPSFQQNIVINRHDRCQNPCKTCDGNQKGSCYHTRTEKLCVFRAKCLGQESRGYVTSCASVSASDWSRDNRCSCRRR